MLKKISLLIAQLTNRLRCHFELVFWVAGLIALFLLPEKATAFSLCPSRLLGLGHCPGCGIGHAIHYALHLQLSLSFQHHPLGIFAVIIIFIRIKQLTLTQKTAYETKPYNHDPIH